MWKHQGQQRPEFAIEPGPGQESVWDYPRPPAIKPDRRRVEVRSEDTLIAGTTGSFRVCETASPPTFYLPLADVDTSLLVPVAGGSVCEWKGAASYWALAREPSVPVGWTYPRPRPRYDKLAETIAFYPGRVACFVDGERVVPQPGRFYGGWITADVVGPFKGDAGTGHW